MQHARRIHDKSLSLCGTAVTVGSGSGRSDHTSSQSYDSQSPGGYAHAPNASKPALYNLEVLCIHVYQYIYIHIHLYIYAHIYVYVHVYVYVYMYIHI